MSSNQYRADIDGLRAIAILFVLIFHFYPETLPGGFVGVDIFFVISGFLITRLLIQNLNDNHFSLLEFYKRRVLRLFPALLVVMCAVLVVGWYALFQEEFWILGEHVVGGIAFLLNFILHREAGYFDPLSNSKPLLHLWSLSVEEQFYLVWPILLYLLSRWRALNATLLAVFTALSFAANFYFTDVTAQFYFPFLRFWQFSLGGWVALQPVPRDLIKNFASYAAFIAVLFGLYLVQDSDSYQHLYVLPVMIGTGIWLATPGSYIAEYLFSNPAIRVIGWISYPLYLWHWPILVFGRMLAPEYEDRKMASVILSFLLAALTYLLVERPIRFQRLGGALRVPALLVGGLTVAMFGMVVYLTGGKGARFNSIEAVMKRIEFGKGLAHSCKPLTGKSFNDDWCNFESNLTRDPSVVLIGDSFSASFATMLKSFADLNPSYDLSYRSYARGRCPSLLNYGPRYCREIVDSIYRYIQETPSVQTVVIANNWNRYINGTRFKEENHLESGESFARALKSSIEILRRQGKRVVVILSPPIGREPQTCVDRLADFGVKENCSIPEKWALKANSDSRRLLVPFFKAQGIPVFDPFDYLCDGERCLLQYQRKFLYGADGVHLETTGGEFLAEKAHDQIVDLILAR